MRMTFSFIQHLSRTFLVLIVLTLVRKRRLPSHRGINAEFKISKKKKKKPITLKRFTFNCVNVRYNDIYFIPMEFKLFIVFINGYNIS